ncbi:hypothetical protein [Faecalibacter sp. LW9]|uniref:hypothetical protein n=1 Tax=Faecalibacter sp. LW9 TaxID=3103144 RepID=UPI002AFEEFE9|nr:hypothetical protein [Faecalibacter sp. LW9]
MRINIPLLISVGLCILYSANGQVKISANGDGIVHPKALLQVDSNTKGIILPSVKDETELPHYDLTQPDNYTNVEIDNGLLLYNKTTKEIMKYDGYRWLSSNEKSIRNYRNLTILGSNAENEVVASVLGITGRPIIKYTVSHNPDRNIINNLGLTVDPNGEITIIKDGYYKINPSLKSTGAGGLAVGNVSIILSLQALYAGAINDGWQKINENSYLLDGLVITVGNFGTVNSFNVTKYLRSGDKIRVKAGITAGSGISLGAGVTFVPSDIDSYLYIEKLD